MNEQAKNDSPFQCDFFVIVGECVPLLSTSSCVTESNPRNGSYLISTIRIRNTDRRPKAQEIMPPLMIAMVTTISIISTFWPYCLTTKYPNHITGLENSILKQSLITANETSVMKATFSFLLLLIPLVLDWGVDIIARLFVSNQTLLSKIRQYKLNDFERLWMYLGFAICPAIINLVPNTYPSLGLLFFCGTRFQILSVLGTMWTSLHLFDKTVWTKRTTMTGFLILAIALNITFYDSIEGDKSVSFEIAGRVLKVLSLAMFMIPSLRWLFHTLRKIYNLLTSTAKESFRDTTLPGDPTHLNSLNIMTIPLAKSNATIQLAQTLYSNKHYSCTI